MILHPTVVALMAGSFLLCFMLLTSSAYGVRILRKWDLRSGSDLQLELERRTYLISTLLAYALGFQLVSLFLFIYTADDLHRLFVGAMCAAGTLNVNPFGYPTLALKVVNFLLAAVWLIMNHADNRAHDYPRIRKKYAYLLVILPFILTETVLQALYFLEMKPNIITSCCGTLFSEESTSVTSGIAALPSIPSKIAFYVSTVLTVIAGLVFSAEPGKCDCAEPVRRSDCGEQPFHCGTTDQRAPMSAGPRPCLAVGGASGGVWPRSARSRPAGAIQSTGASGDPVCWPLGRQQTH